MKGEEKKRIKTIEEAFRRFFREPPVRLPRNSAWMEPVMAEIRLKNISFSKIHLNGKSQFLYWAERLALGGALAASLLVIYFFTSNSLPEEKLTGLMVREPETVILGEYQDW